MKRLLRALALFSMLVTILHFSGISTTVGNPATGEEVVTALVTDWSAFLPEATYWTLTIQPIQVSRNNWEVKFSHARVRGYEIVLKNIVENRWQDALLLDKVISAYEIRDYLRLRGQFLEGRLSPQGKIQLEQITIKINRLAKERLIREPITISLPAQSLKPGGAYILDLVFEARERANPYRVTTFTVPTQLWLVVVSNSIADNSMWVPADLHLHSRYSDGGEARHLYAIRDILQPRGYRIAYMTDHIGQNTNPPQFLNRSQCLCPPPSTGIPPPCGLANTWSCYVTNTQNASSSTGVSFFPGVELSARHSVDGEGHSLGYGITNFPMWWAGQRVYDLSHLPQNVIDVLVDNNSAAPSSAGIAHPTNPVYDWPRSWGTVNYRGVELMSGAQTDFSLTSPPINYWRHEVARVVSTPNRFVYTTGWFPSVRTGSDLDPFNGSKYYTHILIPTIESNWQSSSWTIRRQYVDQALNRGRTIASLRGSWGRVSINGHLPGAIVKNVPTNTTLNMNIRLRPSVNGTAHIHLYRGSSSQSLCTLVQSWSISVTAGTEITPINFTRTSTGGDEYYWLHVDIRDPGLNDIIYTSPIFISSNP